MDLYQRLSSSQFVMSQIVYLIYLLSLKSSPSLEKARSRGGSRVCMAKASLQVSLIRLLTRAKSTSGGKEIRGFTFMELITSWEGVNKQ